MANKSSGEIERRIFSDAAVNLFVKLCIGILTLQSVWLLPVRANSLQVVGSQDSRKQLEQLYSEGNTAYQKRELERAKELFRLGYEKSKSEKSLEFQGKFAEQLSAFSYNEGDLAGAISLLNEGLESTRMGDIRDATARIRLRLAQFYGRKQDYPSAQFQATQATAIYVALDDENGAARARKTQADIDSKIGRYPSAISNLLAVKEVFLKQKNRAQVASVNESLGYAYSRSDQLDKAILVYLEAIPVLQESTAGAGLARCYDGLGATYERLNQDLKAKHEFQKSLEIRKNTPNNETDLAYSYSNLGVVCDKLGHFDEAIQFHREALKIRQRNGMTQDIPKSLTNLAKTYLDSNQKAKALEYQKQSLEAVRKQMAPDLIVRSLKFLGDIYQSFGKLPESLRYFEEAVELSGETKSVQKAGSLMEIGRIHLKLKKYPVAENSLKKAVAIYETLSKLGLDPTEASLFEQKFGNIFTLYSQILVRNHKPEAALEMSERGRTVGISQQVAWNQNNHSNFSSSAQRGEIIAFSEKLSVAESKLRLIDSEIEPDALTERELWRKRAESAKQERLIAEENLSKARDKFFASNPNIRLLKGAETLKWSELSKLASSHPDTLFLSWQLCNGNLIGMAFANRLGVQSFETPIQISEFEKLKQNWNQSISSKFLKANSAYRSKSNSLSEAESAQKLYNTLFGNWEASGLFRKSHFSRIVIRVDGEFLNIPFAALLDSKKKRLIESYAISMTPSFGMLTWATNLNQATHSLLCIADPCGEQGQRLSRSGESAEFGPLPGARLEGEKIAGAFPGSLMLVGSQAQEKVVAAKMPLYRALHFATHTWLDPQQPFRSGLVLSPPENDGIGMIEARKILEMKLCARLTVLSACESGNGESTSGEGTLGLVWAFRAAGCPSIVASQWAVNDSSTRKLMTGFYKLLRQGKRVDDSLRLAMLSVKGELNQVSPFYWAAFQVYGEGGIVDFKN